MGLDARREEFPIVYGNGSGAPETVTMLTRSISEILHDLASLIDVPPEDVATGRTYPTFRAEQADLKRVRIRARVGNFRRCSRMPMSPPSYRGRWFWIENTDFRSKQVFSFIIQLLQLAQTTNSQNLPVITIPSG